MSQKRKSLNIFVYVAVLVSVILYSASFVFALPAEVNLGSAGNFAILSYAGITDVPTSAITGNIGTDPTTGASIGVTCPEVTGTIYSVDAAGPACKVTDATLLDTAMGDLTIAYNDALSRATDVLNTGDGAGEIGGQVLAPGVYTFTGASINVLISTDLTLNGNSNDVWIFQIPGTFDVHANVILSPGVQAKNIFWTVAGQTTIFPGYTVNGNILDHTGIALQSGATLNGRALSQTASVTLISNTITKPLASIPTTGPVFIDTNGNHTLDAGEQFFNHIQDAVNAVAPNDTIVVTSGNYSESVLVNKSLTIVGVGATKPIITGAGAANYVFKIDGTTGVVLDNLEINGGGSLGLPNAFDYGVFVNNAGSIGSPVEIKNSTIKNIWNGGANGIGVEGTSYVLVHNNEISSFHKNGIRFIASTGKFYNNSVVGDSVDGTSRVQNLVNLRGGSNVEIYNNLLTNAITDPLVIPTWGSTGVLVSAYIDGVSVADSQANIHDNEISFSDTGIVITSVYASTDNSFATITHNNFHNLNWSINFEQITGSAIVHHNKFATVSKAVHAEGDTILTPGPVVDAENNWWGTAVESEIQALVYPEVDYSPWYTTGVMNTLNGSGVLTVGSDEANLTVAGNVTLTNPENDVQATIPDGTIITGDLSWNGTINVPAIQPSSNVTPPTAPGLNTHVSEVIEVGVQGARLTFDKAVKIVMPGQSGKKVGYTYDGITFNEITSVCADNTQVTNDLLPAGGECYFDDGTNLTIWTKHFTQFVTYTQTASPQAVNLGTAGNFVILTKSGITNTGSHTSAITGNIGSSPITAAAMDNVFCSEITGTIYGVDAAYTGSGAVTCFAGTSTDKTLVDNAVLDMGTAYNAATSPAPDVTELGAGSIGGLTLVPGVYKWSTDVTIPTDVTLNGNATDVWIFQISGNLDIASAGSIPDGIKVKLIGGAQASNVFWQVGGLTGASLGTYSTFNGNILSAKQVIIQTGAVLNGRALAQTQVTLDANAVSLPPEPPVTPPAAPPEPTRGGDGNGFLSSGNSQAFSYSSMDEGVHSIDFTKEGVAVTHIELETTGIANNVFLTATQLSGKPTNAPTPAIEKLYGYLQIDHNNLGNSLIGSAKIRFKVAKAWMVSNSVQPDQIALYRFTSQWDLLATTMISQDSAYYYFDASSPGLSYFAIGSINTVTTMIPTAPPEPTTPQTPSPVTPGQDNNAVPPNGGIPITGLATGQGGYYPSAVSIAFVIVVVIGLLIGGFFYFRSRNKPPVHH
jgi:PGF-pre-PGF domain-containing protein